MTIREIRKKKHITLDMVTYRSGIPADRYKKIEKGSEKPTDIELRKIALALGVSPEEL